MYIYYSLLNFMCRLMIKYYKSSPTLFNCLNSVFLIGVADNAIVFSSLLPVFVNIPPLFYYISTLDLQCD